MRIVEGSLKPQEGVRDVEDGLRIGRLIQDLPADRPGTILDVVAEAFGDRAAAIAALVRGEGTGQQGTDFEIAWDSAQAVQREINRLQLDADMEFSACSGGQRRRALLAQALAKNPDLLLLDEPTNHLDIRSIEWLESFLVRDGRALLFVTHDRAFLQQVATRIVELDRGMLRSWDCDYRTFLERRAAWLAEEAIRLEKLDKHIAQEAIWAAKNVEARRTKSVGRLRKLEALRQERAQQREHIGQANITLQQADRSGKIVAELKHVGFAYPGGKRVVEDLSAMVLRGDRIGIVGPNGVGKTTLARLLLGELEPTSGSIRQGSNLQVVYFDQRRDMLDEEETVAHAVADENDRVIIGGKARHVHGYLRDFLFTDDRARMRVKYLSGGEKNRLLLAKLFLKPANVLVLDEPTNDLDAETLELLEERVDAFDGTIIVISHDRAFLDAIATNVLIAEGDGRWMMYAGGYTDATAQRASSEAAKSAQKEESSQADESQEMSAKEAYRAQQKAQRARKLSYKEKQELEGMENHIAALEDELASIHTTLADPEFYTKRAQEAQGMVDRSQEIEKALEQAFSRWEELEDIRAGNG